MFFFLCGLLVVTTKVEGETITLNHVSGKKITIDVTLRADSGSGNQLERGCPEFTKLTDTGLHSRLELFTVKEIGGKPLTQITEDARPEMLSNCGFITKNEDILSVIYRDNETVRKLRLTHPRVVKPVFQVINMLDYLTEKKLYDPGGMKYVGSFTYNGNRILLHTGGPGKGCQQSLFNDSAAGCRTYILIHNLSDEERKFLKEKYSALSDKEFEKLEKLLTQVQTAEMEAYYAVKYGFYEGHTDYRADPIALAYVFGLRKLDEIEKALPGELYGLLTKEFTREAVLKGGE